MAPRQLQRLNCSVRRNGSDLLPFTCVDLTYGLNLVTGDNGSGKSSLLLSLAGQPELLREYRLSTDILKFREEFCDRRLVAQDTRFQVIGPTLSNDIEITALLRGLRTTDLETDMTATWEALPAFLERRIGSVSRGELQRFVLAQASSRPPSLLALDEPDGFLDSAGMDKLVETTLRTIHASGGPAVLIVATHRLGEWERRLTGTEWNHVALAEGRFEAQPMCTVARPDGVIDVSCQLKRGMKVRIGRHARRLRRSYELRGHRGTVVEGANGSGKTSLLRAIATDRRISRHGRFVPDWSADIGDVRMVGELDLDPVFSVLLGDQLIEPTRPIAYCSWGQRRLLSMFEALSTPCSYYIFDEPFAGLSRSMQRMIAASFAQKVCEGCHVVLSSNRADIPTHEMDCFDRILIDEYLQ